MVSRMWPEHYVSGMQARAVPRHARQRCPWHTVQTIRVSYKDWEKIGVSGEGMHHEELRASWLVKELRLRGIVCPAFNVPQSELLSGS